jgi:hypothetical protein
MRFKTFLIFLVCAGVILLGTYLSMKFLGMPEKAYKTIAVIVSIVILSFAFLIKDKKRP